MPLKIEIKNEVDQWVIARYLNRNDDPGSISDNKSGVRELYFFRCESDDSKSVIYKSARGIDSEVLDLRVITSLDLRIVAELSRGDASYEMIVKTDRSNKEREVRFTHE